MARYELERPEPLNGKRIRKTLTQALREIGVGDSLNVKFRDYTARFARKAACELGKADNKRFTIDAATEPLYMIITRTK